MRAVVQRVTSASVTVENKVVGQIGKGLCVLIGIHADDTDADMEYMYVYRDPATPAPTPRSARKILRLRLFEDDKGQWWKKSVKDLGLGVLCVSQFTLWGVVNGNKPDFHQAMNGKLSQPMYERLLGELRREHEPDKIQDGVFGAMMQVNICNDGPVTIQLDSRKFEYEKPKPHPHISGGVPRKTGQGSKRQPAAGKGNDLAAGVERIALDGTGPSEAGTGAEDDAQSIYSVASAP